MGSPQQPEYEKWKAAVSTTTMARLGAASFDEAEERRVACLKGSGVWFCALLSQPPSPAFLRACDKLGMLVIDEALDGWQVSKTAHDYHLYFREWWRTDMRSMIDRGF